MNPQNTDTGGSAFPCPKCNTDTWLEAGRGWWCSNSECSFAKDGKGEEQADEIAALRAENARLQRLVDCRVCPTCDDGFEYCSKCNYPLTQCGEPFEDGEPSPGCAVCRLRAENARQAAAIAVKNAALRNLLKHKRHNQYCPRLGLGSCQCTDDESHVEAVAALSDPSPGWLSPEEAAKLREERDAAIVGRIMPNGLCNYCEAELATAREDSAILDWIEKSAAREDVHPLPFQPLSSGATHLALPAYCPALNVRGLVRAARNAGGANG